MPVITISRQTGSGGAEIGQRVANQLGAVYLNRQVIAEVARRLGVSEETAAQRDERAEEFIERFARVLWMSDTTPAGYGPASGVPFEATQEAYVEVTRQLVREAAATGNAVIFGHGAQLILAGQPGVLHVRCVAPLPFRVETIMRRLRVSREEAERRVRDEDNHRAAYVRQYYNADWRDPTQFHIVLNTALLGQDRCVQLILAAAERVGK